VKAGNKQTSHDAVAVYVWSYSVTWCLADGYTSANHWAHVAQKVTFVFRFVRPPRNSLW